eukprot:g7528.t1
MASSSTRALAAVVAAFALTASNVVRQAEAHPNCLGDFAPDLDVSSSFCPADNADGFCCTPQQETAIESIYNAAGVTGKCADLYKEVECGICHPWSGHLFERLTNAMTLTNEFCDEFFAECSGQIALPSDYCDIHTGGATDAFYAYPYVPDDTFSGDGLIKAFPDISDGDLPTNPLDMRMTPDGSKWWVLGLEGEIVEIDAASPTGVTQVMDMSSKIRLTFEEGLLSLCFSPAFHTTGVFYVSYVTNVAGQSKGSNRLSKFQYTGTPSSTLDSEVELITSVEKAADIHSAGWIGFKPSAYGSDSATATHELFWAMGDTGPQQDPQNHGQNPDTLHGSIIRIVVDSQMGPDYTVPGSNPFAGGGGRPEICAQGFRNPFKCGFDRDTDVLYCGDVGQYSVESVKVVECGNNYGWRQFEGGRCQQEVETEFPESCLDVDRSPYTFPIFEPQENRGFVYRGTKFADLLYGNYLFADYQISRLYNLWNNGGGWNYGTVKKNDFFKAVSFAEDNAGEIYMIAYKGSVYEMPCGDICDGVGVNPVGLPSPEIPELEPVVPLSPAPVVATTAPSTATPVAEATPAPMVALTPAPTVGPTPAPVTLAPLMPDETAAPTTLSPTMAPATPTPTTAPVMTLTAAPTDAETPAPVKAETTAPMALPDPTTLAPIFVRTHAPMTTPEPTAPRTASPERLDDDYVPPPVRTATDPPTTPTPVAPIVPVPVAPEDPEPAAPTAPTAVPEPTAEPRAPTPAAPTADFVCDGVLSLLGQYCCPSSCGECGGVGCSSRPGGSEACCTSKIAANGHLCKETGTAPCRILVEDMVPAPAPTAGIPAPTPEGPVTYPEPVIPSTPGSAVPPVSREDFAKCDEYSEIDVAMTGPEEGPVSPAEYLGCFNDDTDERILSLAYYESDAMTPTMCEGLCRNAGGDMFGVQYGQECFCGDSRDTDIEKHGRNECDMPCSGDASVTCGGKNRLDGYYIGGGPQVPEGSAYLGCYADSQRERALGEGFVWCAGTMTVPVCEQFCRARHSVVYGLQYGHECWCGDHMDFDQYGTGKCNYRCVGDAHTTCGGHTAQNVYTLHY